MKKILLIIFLLLVVKLQAQEDKGFSIDVSGGITTPLGDYKTYSRTFGQTNSNNSIGFTEEITGKTQFGLDASYQFGAIGLGASLGIFSHEISSLTYEIDFPTQISGGKIDGIYYGLGPRYVTSFGDFKFAGVFQIGMMNLSLSKFIGSYNGSDVNQPIEILNTEIAQGSNSTLPYTSFGIKFYYPITGQLSAFIKAEYLTSIGNGLKIKDTYVPPVDVNNDGSITSADTELFVNSDNLVEEMRFLKSQFFFFGVGLGYSFGDKDEALRERGLEDHEISGVLSRANDDDADGDGILDTGEQIEFERRGRRNERNILGRSYPNNNSNYTNVEEIKIFSWELLGDKIENPDYKFEVFKIGDNLELQSVYVETTSKTETNHEAAHILQQKLETSLNQNGEGHFKWSVSETTTGITSNYSFFSIRPCQYDFSILNESIECISKDTDNRILKICFDSIFSSPSGDLTFAQQQSRLILYDQNNNALTFNLVNPNPSLMPQSGSGGATLYCLKVTVPNGVTSIGIRLQGDVINTGTDKCTPITNLVINDLPYCSCNDCANKTLTLKNLTISQNGINSNQFNISGNLSSNDPIYGIEFQIMSYGYAAMSPGCTDGVISNEESGMFLIPATTINNASVAMYNETISSTGNTNNLAAKAIQYMSSTPITGTFPVNLTIGLPGPSTGQDANSCRIEYKVCIKAKVYFEDGSCTSCDFSDCFVFNNQ